MKYKHVLVIRKSLPRLAAAILATLVMLPATAAACGHQPGQIGRISLPWLQPMRNLALQSGAAAANVATPSHGSIVGLWHVLLTADGQPFDEAFDVWHSDRTEMWVDNGPPQSANGAGAVCVGVYQKTGPGQYKLNHLFWIIDQNGNLAGSGTLRENVTLDAHGNTFQGTFTEDAFDLLGNLIFEAKGDLTAERITAD